MLIDPQGDSLDPLNTSDASQAPADLGASMDENEEEVVVEGEGDMEEEER